MQSISQTCVFPTNYGRQTYLNCGGEEFNIHKPNLNEWDLVDADTPQVGGRSRLANYSTKSGAVEVVFRDIEKRLIEEINKSQSVVGCVAWLTSAPVLGALRGKLCQIVVQKEDFLRPDMGAQSNWKSSLREKYAALNDGDFIDRYSLPEPIPSMSYGGDTCIEAVRCVGNYNRAKSPAFPRMHNKFLVLGRLIPAEGGGSKVSPEMVWTGSFNITKNAGYSLENALIIRDPKIVDAYASEYAQIVGLSEPLDWQSDWCSPEFRLGT